MIKIKIPKKLQTLITIEQLNKQLLGQIKKECVTPGIQEALDNVRTFFLKSLNDIATTNHCSITFRAEEWTFKEQSTSISMNAGWYVTIDRVLHQVTPEF